MATAPMSTAQAYATLGITPGSSASSSGSAAAAPQASTATASTTASQQATAGAQQVAEAFNGKAFVVTEKATTRDVLKGLVRTMEDPSINERSAQTVYELHQKLFAAEQAMIQTLLEVMAST